MLNRRFFVLFLFNTVCLSLILFFSCFNSDLQFHWDIVSMRRIKYPFFQMAVILSAASFLINLKLIPKGMVDDGIMAALASFCFVTPLLAGCLLFFSEVGEIGFFTKIYTEKITLLDSNQTHLVYRQGGQFIDGNKLTMYFCIGVLQAYVVYKLQKIKQN
jgi:hypothetical protein